MRDTNEMKHQVEGKKIVVEPSAILTDVDYMEDNGFNIEEKKQTTTEFKSNSISKFKNLIKSRSKKRTYQKEFEEFNIESPEIKVQHKEDLEDSKHKQEEEESMSSFRETLKSFTADYRQGNETEVTLKFLDDNQATDEDFKKDTVKVATQLGVLEVVKHINENNKKREEEQQQLSKAIKEELDSANLKDKVDKEIDKALKEGVLAQARVISKKGKEVQDMEELKRFSVWLQGYTLDCNWNLDLCIQIVGFLVKTCNRVLSKTGVKLENSVDYMENICKNCEGELSREDFLNIMQDLANTLNIDLKESLASRSVEERVGIKSQVIEIVGDLASAISSTSKE